MLADALAARRLAELALALDTDDDPATRQAAIDATRRDLGARLSLRKTPEGQVLLFLTDKATGEGRHAPRFGSFVVRGA